MCWRNPDIARFLGWYALTSASEGIVVLALSVHLVLDVGPAAAGLLAFRVLPAACLGAFARGRRAVGRHPGCSRRSPSPGPRCWA